MRAFAIAVATAVVLLAGCGNEATKSSRQVIADARHARDSASSYLVSGIFREPSGHDVSLHLWVANGKGEAGWVWTNYPNYQRRGWKNYDVRVIGTDLYIRGDFASMAQSHGGSTPPRWAWLKASTTSGPLAKLYALVAPSKLFPMLDINPRTLVNRSRLGYTYEDAIRITSPDGGVMRIAAKGTPYPIDMDWENQGNTLTFGPWNDPVPITAPKGAIDASKFGLG